MTASRQQRHRRLRRSWRIALHLIQTARPAAGVLRRGHRTITLQRERV